MKNDIFKREIKQRKSLHRADSTGLIQVVKDLEDSG